MLRMKREKHGSEKNPFEVLIFTLNPEDNERSLGAVSHVIGSDEIKIQSEDGLFTVKGLKHINFLREALEEINNYQKNKI